MIDWFYDTLPGDEFARALHRLREQGEVVTTTALAGAMPVYYIVGHRALAEAFKNGDSFPPGHAYQIISMPFIGETFMSMNQDRHREWRPAMTPSFRRHAVDDIDGDDLAAMGHALLDKLEAAGDKVDLVPNFTRLFAFRVICRQLGLPLESERKYYDWSMDLMFGARDIAKSRAANELLTGIVRDVVKKRQTQPKDDEISRWLSTRVNSEAVSDESIYAHVRLFFTAGATTTSDAMSNLFHALLTHRDAWEHCVAEPKIQQNAIQELLRWNPPVAAQPRFTRTDRVTTFCGHEIPPNSAVLFGIAAANRDPEVFQQPDVFDITRNAKTLLTFGPGLRTCPGMHLAQKNMACALSIVADRFPNLRLADPVSPPSGILLRGSSSLPVYLK